ncbi:MAG: DUF1761 domain-containing protein [Pseudomonadota bacterium]|nr:DUF1761 domain-containing protein [Pseudomonadota bacterium]
MTFAGMNYLAILVAAVIGFAAGFAWYGTLGNQWMAALGKSKQDLLPGDKPPVAAMITSVLALLIMAWALAGVMGHLGRYGVWPGMVNGFFLWLGFVATALAVNHRYQRSPWSLTLIDAGHWLLVLVLQGAVIGWFGVAAAAANS